MRSVTEINGAEPSPVLWALVAAVSLLAAIALPLLVGWLRRRQLRSRILLPRGDGIEPVRRDYLAALGGIEAAWRAGETTGGEALGAGSRLVREFVGLVTDTDAGSMTLSELQQRAMVRPELAAVVDVVRRGYPERFADGEVDPGDVAASLAVAREAVTRWR